MRSMPACWAQWRPRSWAPSVFSSSRDDWPFQYDSSANFSSRLAPMRGKPRLCVLTMCLESIELTNQMLGSQLHEVKWSFFTDPLAQFIDWHAGTHPPVHRPRGRQAGLADGGGGSAVPDPIGAQSHGAQARRAARHTHLAARGAQPAPD